ncbi:MAG: NAD(P)H:quinone oxidoreductase [Myxococcales bacterium]|nr:NAD(P)H:quinone oxidoreductase [Myxococcales bacterium]
MPNVAIIYYSSTGTNAAIAEAIAEGARAAGAEVRLRLVAETAPDAAIDSNPKWRAFVDEKRGEPRATPADLEWADAVVFGTPTRFGNMAAQLKQFIDTLGGAWFQGKLADKVYAGFTSAMNVHGGQEATLLALYTSIHHFGGYIVTPGYTDPVTFASGGNPYGVSVTTGPEGSGPSEHDLAHARYLGRRVAEVAARLRAPRAEVSAA